MNYIFENKIRFAGNRYFIEIPFNVWEETGLKGNIPVRVSINEFTFECKLIPKGNGKYLIPVKKGLIDNINTVFKIEMQPIESLSRINKNSPYSKEHPIRIIDSINEIDSVPGFCGHCCIAMLADVSLDDVKKLIGKNSICWSVIMEALDYFGINYSDKMVYPKSANWNKPQCFIAYINGGFNLWYKDRYYGKSDVHESKIVGYLEILI